MSTLDQHFSDDIIKLLIVGDSGTGKTGGLASLVDAGYNLRILDFEDKLAPLKNYIKDKSKLKNVHYETLKDTWKIAGRNVILSQAAAFQRAMSLMNDWPGLGPVTKWGKDDVLVIDALSSLGRASLNMVLLANNHLLKNPELQHWGTAMDNVEKVVDNLTNSKQVPCHLIVLTHITYQEGDSGAALKAFPEALGSKLNPKIPRKFDNMISISLSGGERSYKLKRDGLIACKLMKDLKEDRLPIETGLADLFKKLRSAS